MEIMLAGICPCKARGKHEKNISRCYRTPGRLWACWRYP